MIMKPTKEEKSREKNKLKPGQRIWVLMRVVDSFDDGDVIVSRQYPSRCPNEDNHVVPRGEIRTMKEQEVSHGGC